MRLLTKIFLLLLIFGMRNSFADVKSLKVIFLSRPQQTSFNFKKTYQWVSPMMAQSDPMDNCQPYGDGCFHPQLGYIEDPEKVKESNKNKLQEEVQLKTINAEEVNLINCDKEYYFDLYCGKAKKGKKAKSFNSKNQLWIDVSSSMRQVDFSEDSAYCERRRFVAKIQKDCGSGLDIYTFNTGRQTMGALESVCINSGTNNGARLVQWLKETQAENIVIVTDVDEYVGEFREYLDLFGAEIEGIGVKPIYASDLFEKSGQLKSFCL